MASIRAMVTTTAEYRPCIAKGKRALFHRWCDSANPALPKGVSYGRPDDYFQLWSCHAIVEFEDGQVARVWPSDVKFTDHKFSEYDFDDDLPFYAGDDKTESGLISDD